MKNANLLLVSGSSVVVRRVAVFADLATAPTTTTALVTGVDVDWRDRAALDPTPLDPDGQDG